MNNLLSHTAAGIFFLTAASLALPSFAQDNSTSDDSQESLTTGVTQKDETSESQNVDEGDNIASEEKQVDDVSTGTVEANKTEDEQTVAVPEKTEEKPKPKKLSIASWGGAYMQAQNNAYFKDYQKDTGFQLSTEKHSGQYDTIKSKLSSGQWDVVDLSYDMVDQACNAGLIAPIDANSLEAAPDGSGAEEDFFKDGIHKCGVASMVWSLTIIYNKKAFRRGAPRTVSDFFNARRYRGKRVLPKTAENTLELALLADGAKPEEVYSLLETPEGIDRAFNRLNRIRKSIIWSTSPSESFKLLANGKAAFGLGYNGRAFSVIAEQKEALGIIWDGQLYNYNLWAIPAKAENKESSGKFITFATNPKRLATQSSWFPYGPSRRSAVQMIRPHPEADIDLRPFIPTIPQNFKLALRTDKKWWKTKGTPMKARFNRWLLGEREPKTEPDVAQSSAAFQSDEPVIIIPEQTDQSEEKSEQE